MNVDVFLSPPPPHILTMSSRDHNPSNKASTGSDIVTEKAAFVESGDGPQHQTLQRQLKNRHVAMIRYLLTFALSYVVREIY